MNILKNGTFCVLPFIHEFQDTNGTRKLCCYSNKLIDSNVSRETLELRQKIIKGEPIEHCQRCYDQESDKTISPRLKESVRWLRDPEIKQYLENWQQDQQLQTFSYDLRFDNKCNLACIGCTPRSSSLWAKELGIETNYSKIDFNINQMLEAKSIYLAGGEPLIIEQFNELLEAVSNQDKQPEIVINTNLTRVGDTIAATLEKIKNLTLTISIDGFGGVNEYHRWPMTWDKFMRNLEWVKDIDCTVHFNSVVDAVSVWGIDQITQIEYIADHWTLNELTMPEALCIKNLPVHLKPNAVEQFEKLKNSRFYSTDLVFRRQVDYIINSITQQGDPELLSMFIDQLDQRRQINHFDYLGIKLT